MAFVLRPAIRMPTSLLPSPLLRLYDASLLEEPGPQRRTLIAELTSPFDTSALGPSGGLPAARIVAGEGVV